MKADSFLKRAAMAALVAAVPALSSQAAIEPGDDDYGTITAAIEAAASGGTVELAAGTFYMTGTLTNKTDVTLKGAGKGETILCGAGYSGGRGLYVDNAAAVIQDLTVTGYTNSLNGVGVYIKKGTLRNVAVTSCTAEKHSYPTGGGVQMEGGAMEGCDVTGCVVNCSSGYSYGGGVYMSGGSISNCTVIGNKAVGNERNGGLYLSNATARDCYIALNSGNSYGSGGGAGVMMAGTSLLENSIVCSNGVGGVQMTGGTMRNTLVFGQTHSGSGYAGVYNKGGTIQHCTIVANAAGTDISGLSGLLQEDGTTVNTILYGNGKSGSAAGSADVTGGKFLTNIVDKAVSSGVGCYVTNPKFKNASAFDYRLGLGSPAVDRAAPLADVTKDLAGVTRNADGKGADIGCYEYVPTTGGELTCAVSVDNYVCKIGDTMVVKASAAGGDGTYTYAFYLDNSATAVQTGPSDTYTWANTTAGRHSVRVVVTDGKGAEKTGEAPQLFTSLPLETYVVTDGGNDYPYDTPAKAARSVNDALNALWISSATTAIVHIAAGTYPTTDGMMLRAACRLVGENAETTILNCTSLSATRAVTMSHADARLEKLTIQNSKTAFDGGAVYMSNGTVADCRFISCQSKPYDKTGGGAIYLGDGLVTNCLFQSCSNPMQHGYGYGAAVYQAKGRLVGCRFEANSGSSTSYDGALFAAGGTTLNCVFTRNDRTPIYNNGGTIVNCLVYGNTCSSKSSWSFRYLAGINQAKGSLWNCTIACNTNKTPAVGCAGLNVTGGTVKNTIVYDCPAADGTKDGYSISGATTANNILDVSPLFVNPSAADFHVKSGSGAIDNGSDDTPATADLEGVARPQQSGYDIGCYEYVSSIKELTAKIVILENRFGVGDPATFSASVEGPNLQGLSYAWFLDGGAYASGSDKQEITVNDAAIGKHTLKLIVTNNASEASTNEVANAFAVYPTTVYVSLDGTHEFPYDSWKTAATNVNTAFKDLWQKAGTVSTMYVDAGTYEVSESLLVTTPFRLVGAGRDRTVLKAKTSGYRCLGLQNADIDVSGLTVSGFTSSAVVGGGVYISGGVFHDACVTNCACKMYDGSCGGGIYIDGGTVRGCTVDDCWIVPAHGYAHGDGVYVAKGTLENCHIRRCWNSAWGFGQGVEAYGGTVRNCLIEGCYSNGSWSDAALHVGNENGVGSAVVENCTVSNNKSEAIRLTKGTLRNLLVVNNTTNSAIASVLVSNGTMVNCTLADNGKPEGGSDLSVTGGTVKNTIAVRASATGGTCANNCFNESVAFKRDYRLRASAANCVNRGDNAVWQGFDAPTDLAGRARIQDETVDIGCYETVPSGLLLLVK